MEVGDPAVDVGQGIVGVQANGIAVIADRFLVFLIIIVGESAVVVVLRVVRVQSNGLGVVADRFLVFFR